MCDNGKQFAKTLKKRKGGEPPFGKKGKKRWEVGNHPGRRAMLFKLYIK